MRHRSHQRTVALGTMLAAVIVASAGCTLSSLKKSSELAARSEPFQARPDRPTRRLLILGDSTAVGTGASTGSASVAGLIARDHPDWLIANRATDGARFADLAAQIPKQEQTREPTQARYDTVLILCGGNDVLRLTGSEALQQSINEVVRRSRALAPRVILMPPGNVGNAPALYPPISWWMTRRSKMLHALVRASAAATGALYVNLYQERADDLFAQEPQRMNAADGLHPSDAGYVLWHQTLKAQAGL